MKKYILPALAFTFAFTANVSAKDISILIDRHPVKTEVSPQIKDGSAYIPIRYAADQLGAEIEWVAPDVLITKEDVKIICSIGSKTAYKNNTQIQLADAPYISYDRTFVNLSDFSKLLGYNAEYQEQDGIIRIESSADASAPADNSSLVQKMDELGVLDYCIAGDWVYYVTLGEEEGFHQMSADGTEDTVICDFSKVEHLGGSTSVSSQYQGDCILYQFQQLRQIDENGELEAPAPIYFYKLDLSDHTLTALSGENVGTAQI